MKTSLELVGATLGARKPTAENTLRRLSRLTTRTLLFVDNANASELDLSEFLPTDAACDVIIATRIPEYHYHSSQTTLVLSKPALNEAVALLFSDRPDSGHDTEPATELAHELDCHPLSLVHAGSYLSQVPETDIPAYLQKYRAYKQVLLASEPSIQELDTSYISVLVTFQLSYQRLKQGAAQLIRLLPYLAMQPLPVAALQRAPLPVHKLTLGSLNPPYSDTQELLTAFLSFFTNKKAGWSAHKFGLITQQLVSFSLLEMMSQGTEFAIHPMLHEALRKTRSLEAPMKNVAAHLIAFACPDWEDTPLDRIARTKLLFHINEFCRTGLDCDPLGAARFAVVYHSARFFDEQCRLEIRIAEFRERIWGFEHFDSLVANANLAITYGDLKQFDKAAAIQKRVFEAQVRMLGREAKNVHLTVSGLISTYIAQKDIQTAETFLESEITKWKDHGQKDIILPELFSEMRVIAETYYELSRYSDAVRLFSRLVERRTEFMGASDNKEVLADKHSLAMNYYSDTQYHDAEKLLLEVVEGRKRVLGEDHLDTLRSKSLLARTYHTLEMNEEAENYTTTVLEARKRLLPKEDWEIASSIQLFAQIKHSAGKYSEARELLDKLLESEKTLHGEDSHAALETTCCLGRLLVEQDFFEEASELFEKVIEQRKLTFGDDDRETELNNIHGPMMWLAQCHLGRGRWSDAEALLKEVLASRRERLGGNHEDTLSAISSLVRLALLYATCTNISFPGFLLPRIRPLYALPRDESGGPRWPTQDPPS